LVVPLVPFVVLATTFPVTVLALLKVQTF
jgi:hypothetical protein